MMIEFIYEKKYMNFFGKLKNQQEKFLFLRNNPHFFESVVAPNQHLGSLC